MNFPINLNCIVSSHNGNYIRNIEIRKGLTILLGPNGSGKTHLLRAMKTSSSPYADGKEVRLISAGRIGKLEKFRAVPEYYQGSKPDYDEANFGDKNNIASRHKIETLEGDFQTLSQRPDILIKVQERLKKLFKRDLIIHWDESGLRVVFARLDKNSEPYSSGREASGLIHLVGILSALYDDEVGALLLDEPEVSLHPQLQSFLLNEIIEASGHPSEGRYKKIIVIATHSTQMLKVSKLDDLSSLVFCEDLNKKPMQIDLNDDVFNSRKLKTLIARLGQEHKLAFFCARPLLVEGPSDAIICNFLSNKLGLHLEAAGSHILPVIGKGEMPTVSHLMSLLGKSPVVLADADAFTDEFTLTNFFLHSSSKANSEAIASGHASAKDLAKNVYSDFCKQIEDNWEDISSIASKHLYWSIRKSDEDEIKAKRRASFCTLFNSEDSTLKSMGKDQRWLTIKNRILKVLELLEISGCFILRKGTIENYYQVPDSSISEGKPSAAVDEISYLEGQNQDCILTSFPEIVRCLEFAASSKRINESESLRDILLSIATPAVARMSEGATTQDIKVLSKTILGERAEIFDLSTNNDQLIVGIKSNILDVDGFPIVIKVGDNVIDIVNEALRL